MSKQVYISADYDQWSGDVNVVEELTKWGKDDYHKVDFIDMSKVSSGSVANNGDCRLCDLTKFRTAGSNCERSFKERWECSCTPYKQNANGSKECKIYSTSMPGENEDCGSINRYSYLRHEFEQAKKKKKKIIIFYNSTRKEVSWLPSYMNGYEDYAKPFWKYDTYGRKVGDYAYIKEVLGY